MIIQRMFVRCKKVKDIPFITLALFLFVSGCAPVISKGLRGRVAREVTFREVLKNPEAYRSKVVLWGGVIMGAKNLREGTLIEILQKPADSTGKPKDVDYSDGRFLALYDGYLDVAIYDRGREVAVAGEVKGEKILPLGEIDYTYPLISIKEIHLFKVEKEERFYRYSYPYWWYHPYWYPWW